MKLKELKVLIEEIHKLHGDNIDCKMLGNEGFDQALRKITDVRLFDTGKEKSVIFMSKNNAAT